MKIAVRVQSTQVPLMLVLLLLGSLLINPQREMSMCGQPTCGPQTHMENVEGPWFLKLKKSSFSVPRYPERKTSVFHLSPWENKWESSFVGMKGGGDCISSYCAFLRKRPRQLFHGERSKQMDKSARVFLNNLLTRVREKTSGLTTLWQFEMPTSPRDAMPPLRMGAT